MGDPTLWASTHPWSSPHSTIVRSQQWTRGWGVFATTLFSFFFPFVLFLFLFSSLLFHSISSSDDICSLALSPLNTSHTSPMMMMMISLTREAHQTPGTHSCTSSCFFLSFIFLQGRRGGEEERRRGGGEEGRRGGGEEGRRGGGEEGRRGGGEEGRRGGGEEGRRRGGGRRGGGEEGRRGGGGEKMI